MSSLPLVLGITGASGAAYAVRLLDVLLRSGRDVHISISPSGAAVLKQELGLEVDLSRFDSAALSLEHVPFFAERKATASVKTERGALYYHSHDDFLAPIASGSFLTGGMVVCPCSGATLSAIALGASGNLIQRAAETQLKERRKLVLVPRETPLSFPTIDNLRRATEAGAVVLPAAPGWYHGVNSLADLVDFVVARICDQLGVPNHLIGRWGK